MNRTLLVSTILCSALIAPTLSRATSVTASVQRDTGASSQIKFTILPGPLTPGKPYQKSFDYRIAPGQTYSAILSIVNASHTAPLTVKLHVVEMKTSPVGGGITFDMSGKIHRLGLWIRPRSSIVTVAPYTIKNVPVTISVPSTAAPGEYGGAFDALDTQAQTVRQGKTSLHLFVNIRRPISLEITGPATVGLKIASARVTKAQGHALLDLNVRDTGTVVDSPVAAVLTFVHMGKVYTLRAPVGRLLGGDSTDVRILLDGSVPAGTYHMHTGITFVAQASLEGASHSYATAWDGVVTVPSGA